MRRRSSESAPANAIYLLDGMPNRNEFGSGAAAQFNQDTIQEFEVITGGFKAEFGHGSGGVVNVLTKSGGNQLKGLGLVFLRDDSLDSSNSLDNSDVPNLERQNFGVNLGGALVRDKVFPLRLGREHRRGSPAQLHLPARHAPGLAHLRGAVRRSQRDRRGASLPQAHRADGRQPYLQPADQLQRGRRRGFPAPVGGHQPAVDNATTSSRTAPCSA